jgi:hybrid polyketide synthase/nonribosomal peptide synthetase ACE1
MALPNRIPFHFVSTISVGYLSGQDTFDEVSISSYPPNTKGSGSRDIDGYVPSKWVSEVFLENVHGRFGLPVCIHRPSGIIGPGAPETDIINSFLYFSRKMRIIPEISNLRDVLDLVDVGVVATNIVNTVIGRSEPLSDTTTSSPFGIRYIHESGQLVLPIQCLKQYLEKEQGFEFQTVSRREWVQAARSHGLNEAVVEYLEAEYLDSDDVNNEEGHVETLFKTSRTYGG